MANRQVSGGRKAVYYIGMVLTVIGVISFFSTFLLFAGLFVIGPESIGPSIGFIFVPAIIGMILIMIGQGLMGVGRQGLAGSGVILDPEQAREDLEPWNRMTGGMVSDAADEAGVNLGKIFNQGEAEEMPFDEKLRRLHQLHVDGILTDEEYAQMKQRILAEG